MQPNIHFKELRKKKLNLSQVELAEQINVTQGTITDIERGRIRVSKRVAKRLQEKFGLELTEIYGNNEKIPNNENDDKAPTKKPVIRITRTSRTQILEDLQKDPKWNKAYTINFQLLKENDTALESFKEVLNQYWQLNRKMFRFIYQYSILYTSELQKEIYERLHEGASDQEIKAEFEERIKNMESLKGIYKEANESLKAVIADLKHYDLKNMMDTTKDEELDMPHAIEPIYNIPYSSDFWKLFLKFNT